ncbi:MAG: uroporphyrinogen-III synthase [Egibacteraceae bacterium]
MRIGVTGQRKGAELVDALTRRGADVLHGPTLESLPPASDRQLQAETDAILAARPAWLVASTGTGMQAWSKAADTQGRGNALRALVAATPAVARGPKALGALRAMGGNARFVSPQETDADVADWLVERVRPGQQVAVQIHGTDTDTAYDCLAELGVDVLRASTYRCVLPTDREPARRLVRAAADGHLDLIVATSATAVTNLFTIAEQAGLRRPLVAALHATVAAAAVGPVTAQAFETAGVPVAVMPTRYRTGDLIRAIEGWARRRGSAGRTGGPDGIELCPATAIARSGALSVALGPREFAVLSALVRRPEVVCAPAQIAREAWGHRQPDDPAQVKHQISRLRRKLGPAGALLETVRGVGYRYRPPHSEPEITHDWSTP